MHANDTKIMRSRDVQCNTKESSQVVFNETAPDLFTTNDSHRGQTALKSIIKMSQILIILAYLVMKLGL